MIVKGLVVHCLKRNLRAKTYTLCGKASALVCSAADLWKVALPHSVCPDCLTALLANQTLDVGDVKDVNVTNIS